MKANPYQMLRRMSAVRSGRLRLFGAWLLSVTGRRYLGVFLDPVLGCNLRCRMCYFSDAERRKELHGQMDAEALEAVAQRLFPRALKLQIGCGAEPTLYKRLPQVVALGKRFGVPYISITTNGQLLTDGLLQELLAAGLDEITLSLHGLTQSTYEEMMPGASFARFRDVTTLLSAAKKTHPVLAVRLNYTMNSANTDELALLPDLLQRLPADVVQLRPVQQIGESDWLDFSLGHIEEVYGTLLQPLAETLRGKGVMVLMPALHDLQQLDAPPAPLAAALQELTYCNVEPQHADSATLPRLSFSGLFKLLLGLREKEGSPERDVTKKLAYQVQ